MVKKKKGAKNSKKIDGWKVATIILAIIVLIQLSLPHESGASKAQIKEKIENLFKKSGVSGEVKSIKEESGLYNITVSSPQGDTNLFVTLDGKNFVPLVVPMEALERQVSSQPNEQPAQEIPKSQKPKVELFVMSYCPFGTQMEKGFLPVLKLLKDDIDFSIKFVNYAMHPSQGEVEENLRQYCIQKEQKDKFYDYLSCFLEKGDSSSCITKTQINKEKLSACEKSTDKKFNVTKNLNDHSSWLNGRFPRFLIHDEENKKYGVQGSPTLVINGVQAQTARDSASILKTICSSFTNPPEKCNTELSSAQPSPGFGFSEATSQNMQAAAAACGA
ncbi:hypothetical protein D6829_00125 [Candidatus Pacearchaeota archaeon]|nr:MAG: hypothetical protein D6829_00125 [Candidatus Pacearchaeota archaeon]